MSTLEAMSVGLGLKPALLVIDATRGFTDPASPLGCDGSAALARIALLLDAFRVRGLPVFFTSNAYANPCEAAVFRQKLPVLNQLVVGGTWAEIDPRVQPLPHEPVLRKTVPSAFFDSPLRTWLSAAHVDGTVLCGFSTSGCVRASAVDALQCDLRVTVAADACGDRDLAAHDYNLRDLGLKTGDVRSSAHILELLSLPLAPI
ncbi:isochorismatase family protein [Paucibacter sp. JuS9]|uniref:isochorismatase family protein n=1 Tax=Paucibacter sp. JuS9 TaxID=3228748 RepID=UPI0037578616